MYWLGFVFQGFRNWGEGALFVSKNSRSITNVGICFCKNVYINPAQLGPQCFLLVLVLIISQHFHFSQQPYCLFPALFLACYFMLDNLNVLIFVNFPNPTTILFISLPILTSFSLVSEQLFFLLFSTNSPFWWLILSFSPPFLETHSFLSSSNFLCWFWFLVNWHLYHPLVILHFLSYPNFH